MKNKNIFEKNAQIPDIVQQKANAAFRDIYTRQDEPEEKPQKTYKPTRATVIKIASTVVAAAITVVALFFAISYFGGKKPEQPEQSELSVGTGTVEKRFSIMVCEAELEPQTSLPISLDVGHQTFGHGCDWTGCADYQINFPITVGGENISSVTFKADNAVIEVVSIDCPSIVKSGSPKTLDDFNSTYVNGYDMAGQPIGKTEVGYYESFSTDYGTLQNSKYLLNICNAVTDRMDLYYMSAYYDIGNNNDWSAVLTYFLKDATITIDVTFNDGTTASRTLGLFANIYLATDTMDDGTEYQYDTVQIFCYDKNDVDAATKQLISSQIARAVEIWKEQEAKHPITPDDTKGYGSVDEPIDETIDETDTSVSTETTAVTDATAITETTVNTEPTAGTDATVSTETTAVTDTTVSTEETKTTDEVSSTENTDNVNSDN